MTPSDLELIRNTPLFAALPIEQLGGLMEEAMVHRYPAGTILFDENSQADFLHVLLEGNVALLGSDSKGKETVVEITKPGDIFITAAVLLDQPCLMSARVISPARIALLQAKQFRRHLSGNMELTAAVNASLAESFRSLVRQIKDLKLHSSAQRLGGFLLRLAGPGNAAEVTLPFNKGLIATRLGMTPEHLARAFAQLECVGVSVRDKVIGIGDAAALRAFSDFDD